MVDVSSVADELYGLPRETFILERKARVADHRDDRALADAIGSLRKPTAAAELLNMLARNRPEVLHAVAQLGDRLRAAHEESDGAALRALGEERRAVVSAAVEAARAWADERGGTVGQAAETALVDTLRASSVDSGVARAVLSGRLVHEVSASGFEPVDLDGVVAGDLPDLPPRPTTPRSRTPDGAGLRKARDVVKNARRESDAARRDAETAGRRLAELERRRDGLAGELESLRRHEAELDGRIADLDTALRRRHRDVKEADDVRRAADRALERGETALRDLEA